MTGRAFADCVDYLSPREAEVLRTLPDPLRLWGATPPTRRDGKARAIEGSRVGDVVFFVADAHLIATARIAHRMENSLLAAAIWGLDDETGLPWRHMMVLSGVVPQRVPIEALVGAVRVALPVRTLQLLDDAASDTVLAAWQSIGGVDPVGDAAGILQDLVGTTVTTVTGQRNHILEFNGRVVRVATNRSPEGEAVEIQAVQRGLDLLRDLGFVYVTPSVLGYRSAFVGAVLGTLPGAQFARDPARVVLTTESAVVTGPVDPDLPSLDGSAERTFRREQGQLRKRLLGGRDHGTCALCGREFPADLLVAAHIKKRSWCDNRERADLDNVAMLACKLGCDALFEEGYVSVDDNGRIVASPSAFPLAVAERIGVVAGEPCRAFTPASRTYFHWHLMKMLRP